MIELDYRLNGFRKEESEGLDLQFASWNFLFLTAFSSDQIFIVNGFDCSLRDFVVPALFFAGTLFREVSALKDRANAEMPYLLDEDINLYLSRKGANVTVQSNRTVGEGQCAYEELVEASAHYARRVLVDCLSSAPNLAKNKVLKNRYPVADLDLEHLFSV